MDAKALLKYAADKLSATDAAVVLGKTDLVFLGRAQWHGFDSETSQMQSLSGGVSNLSASEITGVRLREANEAIGQNPAHKAAGVTTPGQGGVARIAPMSAVRDSAGGPLRAPDAPQSNVPNPSAASQPGGPTTIPGQLTGAAASSPPGTGASQSPSVNPGFPNQPVGTIPSSQTLTSKTKA